MKKDHTEPPLIGKDELNLIEIPFTLLTDSAESGQKTLEFTDRQNEIIRNWTITGSDKYGLPCAYDEPVYVAMMALTKRDGFASRKVYFNPYEMLKLMRWPINGRQYDRLELALNRLTGVTIYTDYFWDRGEFKKRLRSVGFHILDESLIDVGRKSKKNSYFKWGDTIFESFIHGNLKNLNLSIYFDLKSIVSKRFYRLWDKRLHKIDRASFDLKDLCHEKLGISRNLKYPSLLKQALSPALKEYKSKKLLSSTTYIKKKDGNWMLNIKRYKADPGPLPLPEISTLSGSAADQRNNGVILTDNVLTCQLINMGVAKKVAEGIVSLTDPDVIQGQIEALPFRKNIEDRAAFLIRAIQENFPFPPEFQKKLNQKKFEQEKLLKEKYDQWRLTQAAEFMEAMDPVQLQKEIEKFKKWFMAEWGLDEISPAWMPKFENDFKWQKAKKMNLPTFEQWQSK